MANWVRGVHRELGRYLQKDRNHDESNVYEDFVERNERKRKRSELIERFWDFSSVAAGRLEVLRHERRIMRKSCIVPEDGNRRYDNSEIVIYVLLLFSYYSCTPILFPLLIPCMIRFPTPPNLSGDPGARPLMLAGDAQLLAQHPQGVHPLRLLGGTQNQSELSATDCWSCNMSQIVKKARWI